MHHIDTLNGYMVNDRSLIKLLVCTHGARIEDIGTKVINCNKLQTADGSDGFFFWVKKYRIFFLVTILPFPLSLPFQHRVEYNARRRAR